MPAKIFALVMMPPVAAMPASSLRSCAGLAGSITLLPATSLTTCAISASMSLVRVASAVAIDFPFAGFAAVRSTF
jgi:hypothetical protein